MIIPIRCVSCGSVIADKWLYYERQVKKLEEEVEEKRKKGEDDGPQHKNMDNIPRGKILDELGLTRLCCRRHFIANVSMMDLI